MCVCLCEISVCVKGDMAFKINYIEAIKNIIIYFHLRPLE